MQASTTPPSGNLALTELFSQGEIQTRLFPHVLKPLWRGWLKSLFECNGFSEALNLRGICTVYPQCTLPHPLPFSPLPHRNTQGREEVGHPLSGQPRPAPSLQLMFLPMTWLVQ